VFFILSSSSCINAKILLCPAEPGTPGAEEELPGRYYTRGISVPFSCMYVCGEEAYNIALINVVVWTFLIPIFVSYLISCLLLTFPAKKPKPSP